MIIDFTVSNFRSIKEPQTISFEATDDRHLEDYYVIRKGDYRLLKMATLIGANASGKSNMLQAYMHFIRLMRLPCENKTDKITYDKFAFDEDSTNHDSSITINFICGNHHYRYSILFNNDMVAEEYLSCKSANSGDMETVFERTTDRASKVSAIKLHNGYQQSSTEIDKMLPNILHNRTVFGAYHKSNVDIPWLRKVSDWMDAYLLPVVTTSEQGLRQYTSNQIFDGKITKEQVASFLRKADVGINDFSVRKVDTPISPYYAAAIVNDKYTPDNIKEQAKSTSTLPDARVKMMHSGEHGSYELDFGDESRGTQRYYEMAGVVLELINTPHIVAIDELENAMHPDLYEHFLVTFLSNAKESQILCTTHMREFLADKNLYRDDSVWIAQKDRYGATEIYSIADFDKEELKQVENRYGAYRSGRLGGIPQLGDTYVEPLKNDKQ